MNTRETTISITITTTTNNRNRKRSNSKHNNGKFFEITIFRLYK